MEEKTRLAVHSFWDELAGEANGNSAALNFALDRLSKLVDAQEAYWIGAVRLNDVAPQDPVQGWRPRAVQYLSGDSRRQTNYELQRRLLESGQADPSIIANAKGAGHFRVNIKHKLVGKDWFQSDYYRTYMAPLGIQDVLLSAMPLSENMESWWVFQRINHEQFFFTTEEAELLHYAVRSLAWFHRQVALQHGLLLANKPLTASERNMVRALLTEKNEKEIADELSLSPKTVHTYAVRIYRKFNVRGRMGLVALWLGQNSDDKAG